MICLLIGMAFLLAGCGSSIEKARSLNREGKRAEAVAMAKDLLKGDDPKVQVKAADLLGDIGGMQAGEALMEALDYPSPVQDAAIRNLGKMRHEPASKKLVSLVPGVRGETFEDLAKAIRQIGVEATDVLVKKFSNSSGTTKDQYKKMILAVGPTVADSVAKNLTGKSYFENKGNFDILIAFKNPRVAGLLLEYIGNIEVAPMVVEGLTKLGSMSVNPTIAALEKLTGRSGDTVLKERLIEVLGNLQDQRAVPLLEKLTLDDDDRVRNKATTALRKIRGF
jgi:HEAT repeat protein